MKQCPICKTTYTDESMSFCLTDGVALLSFPNEQETVQVSFDKNPMQVNFPQHVAPVSFQPPNTKTQPIKQGVNPVIVAAIVGLLVVIVVGLTMFIFLKSDKITNANLTLANSQNATPNDETAELKEKLSNLEKQVQDQKKTPIPKPSVAATPVPSNWQAVRVKPTKDRFLALRSEPNTESGDRVTTMPSGATVYLIGSCQTYFTKVSGKSGRWCQVSYNGYTGWAFDAWLDYY